MRAFVPIFLALASVPLSGSQGEAALPDCTQAPHTTLAFMPGEWEVVRTGTENIVGFSSIGREPADECAVKEEFFPESGPEPVEIISRFDRETGAHRQAIFGMSPTHISTQEIETDGTISFQGTVYNLSNSVNSRMLRMTYTALPEGGFRQQVFVTADEGENWRRTIDVTYRSITDEG